LGKTRQVVFVERPTTFGRLVHDEQAGRGNLTQTPACASSLVLYSGTILKQQSMHFAIVQSYRCAKIARVASQMLETCWLILATFELCVLAMPVA
jgi:hypothetical protein